MLLSNLFKRKKTTNNVDYSENDANDKTDNLKHNSENTIEPSINNAESNQLDDNRENDRNNQIAIDNDSVKYYENIITYNQIIVDNYEKPERNWLAQVTPLHISPCYETVKLLRKKMIDNGLVEKNDVFDNPTTPSGYGYVWKYECPILVYGQISKSYGDYEGEVKVYASVDKKHWYKVGYVPKRYESESLNLMYENCEIILTIGGGECYSGDGMNFIYKDINHMVYLNYRYKSQSFDSYISIKKPLPIVGLQYHMKNVNDLVRYLKNNYLIEDNDYYKCSKQDFIYGWMDEPVYEYQPVDLKCSLKNENDNPKDKNAIAVLVTGLNHEDIKIGYIPKEHTHYFHEISNLNIAFTLRFSGIKYKTVEYDEFGDEYVSISKDKTPFKLYWEESSAIKQELLKDKNIVANKIRWKHHFYRKIRIRGEDIYKSNKLEYKCEGNGEWSGIAHGTNDYEVTVRVVGERVIHMSCTCPFAKDGNNCKHMAALLTAIDEDIEGHSTE